MPRIPVRLRTLTLWFTLALFAAPAALTGQRDTTRHIFDGLRLREIGPVIMSGRVVDLAVVESNPYTFYIGTATGGVWKTTNNGVTVEPVFFQETTHSVGDVVVHQRDTNIVWVGTGERANRQSSSWGDGVYKSTDGGTTWANMGLRDSHHIGRIVMSPDDPDIVYVAAMGHLWGPNEERGLYVTRDGGETWTRTLSIDENTGVVDVAIDPVDPLVLYAATYQRRRSPYGFNGGGPGSGLHKSTNGGETWRELTTGLPQGEVGRIGISIYRSNPSIVYISVEQGWQYNASTAYGERRAGVYRSENRGESWEHMSDWNPRPMYASQPLVDPNDDQRIYMMNAYSRSDDGGRTFQPVRQSLHGDDRIFWVDPNDSRHVMKGDDGGLGISYDRGDTWIFLTHLPVSQYYRVTTDMRDPYWIYGGLQDNGSWAGPSATYRSEGIALDDWFRTGGGDGFLNLVDTTDNRTLYTESQYLGLSRLDLVTRIRTDIRPDNARGAIAARRNWDAWGPGTPEPELANAMAPANWDGPFTISPHDSRTLYAGTNIAWKSTDRGDTWIPLGDLTTGVDRRELLVMGQRAHDSTLSLDDGIPYYPTLTAIEESPVQRGLLYAGTDDGNVQVSRDDGANWTNVSDRLPGLAPSAWVNGIEASQHDAGTVYVTINNYRNDDFTNYLYRSRDSGMNWEPIVGDLPADRVLRTLREDIQNPDVLYLGTEFGLFYSNDRGSHWMALTANLPTVPINDLVLHPRENDLILGTHGRGIWILDQINALQELTPTVLASRAHLFSLEPASQIRYSGEKAHTGELIFRGENPPSGTIIDYYLRESTGPSNTSITIHDASGAQIADVRPQTRTGINRVVWNLRADPLVATPDNGGRGGGGFGRSQGLPGAWVLPGEYTVRLTVDGQSMEQPVIVREDPRIAISDLDRRAWHQTVVTIGALAKRHLLATRSVEAVSERLDALNDGQRRRLGTVADEVEEILPLMTELRDRLAQLYAAFGEAPGMGTADQRAQIEYYREWADRLAPRAARVAEADIGN